MSFLVAYIALAIVLLGAVVGVVYGFQRKQEARMTRLRAARASGAIGLDLDFLRKEKSCFLCHGTINPARSYWDPGRGWLHTRCVALADRVR